MKYYQEVTIWDRSTVPNHIYYLNDSKTKMVGYIQSGTTQLQKFKEPISIDTRGRKFIEVKNLRAEDDSVYFGSTVMREKSKAINVLGSNGKVYQLVKNKNGKYSCSCPGYTFRRHCKHIVDIKEN